MTRWSNVGLYRCTFHDDGKWFTLAAHNQYICLFWWMQLFLFECNNGKNYCHFLWCLSSSFFFLIGNASSLYWYYMGFENWYKNSYPWDCSKEADDCSKILKKNRKLLGNWNENVIIEWRGIVNRDIGYLSVLTLWRNTLAPISSQQALNVIA